MMSGLMVSKRVAGRGLQALMARLSLMAALGLSAPLWLTALLLCTPLAQAAIDTYDFSDDQNRQLFRSLTEELRCPKCQNQNLADSNSPIASDMRREIHRLVEEGQSGEQVTEFMVARYGDFVRYRPKRDSSTALLWYGPIVLLILGVLVVVSISLRGRSRGAKPTTRLDDAEQQRLKRLLDEDKDNGTQ